MNTKELLEKYSNYTIDNIEDLLSIMRKDGLSMVESAMLLFLKFKISIPEADKYILNSKTWKDSKDFVEKFRNNIFDNIDKLNNRK